MKYALYDAAGNLTQAVNDLTITELPANSIELTDQEFVSWANHRANDARTGVVLMPPNPDVGMAQ